MAIVTSPPVLRVLSTRTVKPPHRSRELIPLTWWDVSLLAADYIEKGLLFLPPPSPRLICSTTCRLQASLVDALATYYPVTGRFTGDKHDDDWSVSIDCSGQGWP
jgi:hypothetical protein